MNLPLSSVLYGVVSLASLWLALMWIWPQRRNDSRPGNRAKILAGAATALLLFAPIGGVPLWSRAFSYYPNPSLTILGIICAALWTRISGRAVFKRADWHAIWIFGAIAGSVLYLHAALFTTVDLYFWGWDRTVSALVVGAMAVTFFVCGSRFGVLLLVALLGYSLSALESRNCWDYVMDPLYWLISVCVLAVRAFIASLRWFAFFAPVGR